MAKNIKKTNKIINNKKQTKINTLKIEELNSQDKFDNITWIGIFIVSFMVLVYIVFIR